MFSASTPIEEVSEALDIRLPEGEYDTLSGFLMDQFGRIPEVGEQLEFEGYRFVVEAADPRGIERAKAEKITLQPTDDETPSESVTAEEG